MKGSPIPQYPIPNKLAEHVIEPAAPGSRPFVASATATTPSRRSASLTRSPRSGPDPTAFRLELSEGQPRMQTLLRTVAEMSDWASASATDAVSASAPW